MTATPSTPDLIRNALVVPALTGTDKEAVLDEMLAAAVAGGLVRAEHQKAVRSGLNAREDVGSTGIGNGVAVPHTKSTEVEEIAVVFARSAAGVPFQAVDGRDVHLMFMVLAPADGSDVHLTVLRWISKLARNEDFRRFAIQTGDEVGLRDLLVEMGGD